MAQLQKILESLSWRQRITILLAALFVGGAMVAAVRWKKEADFRPLYTGLAAEDSAAVVQKLKEGGSEYRLSEAGDVISVPSARLAELRLEMAAAGLPKTGRIGFEIFDKNNLGASEFVEHINFQRALEGELERSVSALGEVEQSRVHITFPKDSVFVESRETAKASVMVKLKPGAHLAPRNVTAIQHLVGSAVEGLQPDSVSVLDMQGNLLSRPLRSPDEEASDVALDYRQKVEHDLAQKIGNTLDPLLGHDRYRAGVTVECDLTSGEQSEETIDPTRSAMVQSQKTEETVNGGATGGVPGTASNLPRPTKSPTSSTSTSHRTESITYESSKTIRKVKLPGGDIKRVAVAILLDQNVRWEGSGPSARRVLVPPSPELIKSVRDVVVTVSGIKEDRGDQITVESLPFENTLNLPAPDAVGPAPKTKPQPKWTDWKNQPLFIPVAVGAAVAILLIVVIVLLMRGSKKKGKGNGPDVDEAAKAVAGAAAPKALTAANIAEQLEAQLAERAALQEQADQAALASIKVPPVKTKKSEVLVKQLKENAKKDVTASAHVLQTWIHDRV